MYPCICHLPVHRTTKSHVWFRDVLFTAFHVLSLSPRKALNAICIFETGILAIAVLLGLAIFILLCILVYCFVKGKHKSVQHHRVPVSSAPVTTMEDRDRLVYNSTTKPIWPLKRHLWTLSWLSMTRGIAAVSDQRTNWGLMIKSSSHCWNAWV